jgi:hypothetical protein
MQPLQSYIGHAIDPVLIGLQGYVVLFLLLHDWVPLGRLNNRAAKRRTDSLGEVLWTTLVAGVPAAIALWGSATHLRTAYPGWLLWLIWITYGVLLFGLLRAWWIPYLFFPDAARAERYRQIFAGTHRFLPERNGITPDTLHISFHVATVLVLVLLAVR